MLLLHRILRFFFDKKNLGLNPSSADNKSFCCVCSVPLFMNHGVDFILDKTAGKIVQDDLEKRGQTGKSCSLPKAKSHSIEQYISLPERR